jgi:hypothetical protein
VFENVTRHLVINYDASQYEFKTDGSDEKVYIVTGKEGNPKKVPQRVSKGTSLTSLFIKHMFLHNSSGKLIN